MRFKRLLGAIMTACLLITSMPIMSADAADNEWVYELSLKIANWKNAKTKKNKVKCILYFNYDEAQSFTLKDTNKSNHLSETQFTSSYAPWQLDYVEIENTCGDGFMIHDVTLFARKGDKDWWCAPMPTEYPGGKGEYDGYWIHTGAAKKISYTVFPERKITALGNFDSFEEDIIINPESASGTKDYEYNGNVSDQYARPVKGRWDATRYYCMDLQTPPTFSYEISGVKADGGNVTKTALENAKAITAKSSERGFSLDKAKLKDYMNQNGVNKISVTSKIAFPRGTYSGQGTFTKTLNIVRSAFTIDTITDSSSETITFSPNYYASSRDNNFYNNTLSYNEFGEKFIAITARIKTRNNNNHITADDIDGSYMTFKKAYIRLGNTGKTLDAFQQLLKKVKISGDKFTLLFPYSEGADSQNGGIELVLEDAKITPKSYDKSEFSLWSENKKPNTKGFTALGSAYKIDAVVPHVKVTEKSGEKMSDWHKTITLTSTPTKKIYADRSNSLESEGFFNIELFNSQNWKVNIYDYKGKTPAASKQRVPAGAANVSTDFTLALKDEIEGTFTLKISGRDEAGNTLSDTYTDIKLDNKAPQVSLIRENDEPRNGAIGLKYKASISDASGTGTIYYCFTKNDPKLVPAFDKAEAEKQPSGAIDSLLDKWAHIKQSDVTGGNTAAAYTEVKKGEHFKGWLVYFGMDDFGNKTETYTQRIDVDNENADCVIYALEDTSYPRSNYSIVADTDLQNNVSYRWRDQKGNYITDYETYTGVVRTEYNGKTNSLNGTYYFECKVKTPSGKQKVTRKEFVFDNSGPEIVLNRVAADEYARSQTISAFITDVSEVKEAYAKIVNPDGSEIEGMDEFALSVSSGTVSQDINIADTKSGAYALTVRAIDTNGYETVFSEPFKFFIRNSAAEVSAEAQGNALFNEKAVTKTDSFKLKIKAEENFKNAQDAQNQKLYYRISEDLQTFGEWRKADGVMTALGDTLTYENTINVDSFKLKDGENFFYIETAIAPDNYDTGKFASDVISQAEFSLYFDNTAPAVLQSTVEDKHTAENITGKIYLFDNLSAPLTLACASDSVKITESDIKNVFDITVTDNVNTTLEITDTAGNTASVPLVIKGIDKEAPTADINVWQKTVGARTDAYAEINVYAAASEEGSAGNETGGKEAEDGKNKVEFALIPKAEISQAMTNGKINEKYFTYDRENIKIDCIRNVPADWDGEANYAYSVQMAGITAEYYIGVRTQDSLGNSMEQVFDTVLSSVNADLTMTSSISPKKTGVKAIVKLDFNMPVYVLPQNSIVSDVNTEIADTVDEMNLILASENAGTFSQSNSFVISKTGEYKLYTCDDIGRTKMFTLNVTENDVQFGALGGVKAEIYVGDRLLHDGEMTAPGLYDSEGNGIHLTLKLKPTQTGMVLKTKDTDKDGFVLDKTASEKFYDEASGGYTELVYNVYRNIIEGTYEYVPEVERMLEIEVCTADGTDSTTVPVIIDCIDNTFPECKISVSPNIFKYDEYDRVSEIVGTPGNVTFTVMFQDKESGIESIVVTEVHDPEGINPPTYITIPMKDENGNYIDYDAEDNEWSWSGENDGIPVSVKYSGNADPKGVKVLTYTFTDNAWLYPPAAVNGAGDSNGAWIGGMEGFTTGDAIYKMNIEQGEDYTVTYYKEDINGEWVEAEIPAAGSEEKVYFRRAKAVISLLERGENRELRVVNNNGSFEKILDSYVSSFTFELKDKYGYKKSVTAGLENFDAVNPTIDYKLSETAKTKGPITVTINANDDKSGVGTVELTGADGQIAVTKNGAEYTAKIYNNGTYSIKVCDNAGNKAVKNFSISNVDSTSPKMTDVILSNKNITSRSVIATPVFSKNNVKIMYAEPTGTLTEDDYIVNKQTGEITFSKSGTLSIFFQDEYGNEGADTVVIDNIDTTPPMLDAVWSCNANKSEVSVKFQMSLDEFGNPIDKHRQLSDIFVMYGGIIKMADEAEYILNENGTYTFKAYDDEGLVSYITLEVTDIDLEAPKITQVRWTYDKYSGSLVPNGEAGFRIGSVADPATGAIGYPVTNGDVTVTVETDKPTRKVGSSDEYSLTNETVYTDNGLYIFNLEKSNRQTASYGFDVEIIDKTPPVIDFLGKSELVFYENTQAGDKYDKKYLTEPNTAFKAYDTFGTGTDLTDKVKIIDWGGFDADNLENNTFSASSPYTITYQVMDNAGNITVARRTVRLVGMYDTIALVNGALPNYSGTTEVESDRITVSLKNFSPTDTAYVRYERGLKSMGQMKKAGTVVPKDSNGEFTVLNLEAGWYTFLVQTDKRDYFTLRVYLYR